MDSRCCSRFSSIFTFSDCFITSIINCRVNSSVMFLLLKNNLFWLALRDIEIWWSIKKVYFKINFPSSLTDRIRQICSRILNKVLKNGPRVFKFGLFFDYNKKLWMMLWIFFSFKDREWVKFFIFKNLRFMKKHNFSIAVVHFELMLLLYYWYIKI